MKSQLLIINCLALLIGYLAVKSPVTVEACGPGRGGGRQRPRFRYPPLVVRQYIPNVSENTLAASGRPEGAIQRRDKRFRELVQNTNPDIDFRDDEGTGADRMMSQRLKEKLSTLAISVMNRWPNVKLRVIEGWDEDYRHSPNSLHYEGRAVDITTSDRDQSKYGMLARLAVEAGFDWVHYESRSHVHCSVKSERADIIRNNGCFDNTGLVETPQGAVRMSQLQVGDLVLTMNPTDGQLNFSPIIMWLDRDENKVETYVELKTESGKTIHLTPSHLIYVAATNYDRDLKTRVELSIKNGGATNQQNYYYSTFAENENSSQVPSIQVANLVQSQQINISKNKNLFITYAHNVSVNQYLVTHNNAQPEDPFATNVISDENKTGRFKTGDTIQDDVQRESGSQTLILYDKIVSVSYVTKKGIHAPLTREGNIVVNSVLTSCYAVIWNHRLAHLSFAPVRWLSYLNEWLYGLEPPTIPQFSKTSRLSQYYPILNQREDEQQMVGTSIHWYPLMLYRIAEFILPTRYLGGA